MSRARRLNPNSEVLDDSYVAAHVAMTTMDSEALAYRLRHATVDRNHRAPPLHLLGDVLADLTRLAEAGYPHEVCGLLVGHVDPEGPRAVRLVAANNLNRERAADRYQLDPDDFVAVDRAARGDGLEIIGIWHTHPDSPAWPSVTDLEAAWEGYSYLIASLRGDGRQTAELAELRSWRLGEERLFLEEPLANGEQGLR